MSLLPESYCDSMKTLLQEEYTNYIDSMSEETYAAIRINTKKISISEWNKINPFSTSPIAWVENGFYFDTQKDAVSKHPFYYAGLYYIQEPSAMIPASLLPVNPGDRVLDLCAAPGGKATELGAKLKGQGLLVANDISVSRTMALAKNLQMAGIENMLVTAETPEHLAIAFPHFFDKILIDAPCSGEGMFRREPRMIKDWLEKGPDYYAKIQKEILEQAYEMLREGGQMVYSTCTFSVMEDEGIIKWFLQEHSDMEICSVDRKEGFSKGRPDMVDGPQELEHCVRIFPHKAKGEGHFAALLRKKSNADKSVRKEDECDMSYEQHHKQMLYSLEQLVPDERNVGKNVPDSKKARKESRYVTTAYRENSNGGKAGKRKAGRPEMQEPGSMLAMTKEQIKGLPLKEGTFSVKKNVINLNPLWTENLRGLRIVHKGLPICELKQKLAWSHQLALCLKKEDFPQVIDLEAQDDRVIRYLKGETLQMDTEYSGNVLVCVNGYGLGWCQGNGKGMLKNKYYPGWRYQ